MGMGVAQLATAGMAAQGFSAGYGAVNSYYQAAAQRRAGEYAASVSEQNAQSAEWAAQDALLRGKAAESRHRMRVSQEKGSARARLAAQGVDLGEGSALALLTDIDWIGDVDAAIIRSNADREAYSAREQARGYRNAARMQRAGAQGISPFMAGATSLIGGAGQVADRWYRYKSTGIGGGGRMSSGQFGTGVWGY